ncbi:MAG: hypothetical protein ACYTAN_12715 [Planctomycetota bacterium]
MIDFNPLYLEMEVVTLLPRHSAAGYALLNDLVEDLGTEGQRPIRDAIEILRDKHKLKVKIFHSPVHKEGQAAAIPASSWPRAKALAESYLSDADWAREPEAVELPDG